ncbi:MAG: nitrile hydratase accessory protein [Limibacillus sp.]
MSQPDLPPLPLGAEDEAAPRFAEPWHAQLFALTLRLSESGHFTWPEWAAIFGEELKRASEAGAPKDGSAYYDVWLTALERLLSERGLAAAADLAALKQAWEEAYLATPHGQPVKLRR